MWDPRQGTLHRHATASHLVLLHLLMPHQCDSLEIHFLMNPKALRSAKFGHCMRDWVVSRELAAQVSTQSMQLMKLGPKPRQALSSVEALCCLSDSIVLAGGPEGRLLALDVQARWLPALHIYAPFTGMLLYTVVSPQQVATEATASDRDRSYPCCKQLCA